MVQLMAIKRIFKKADKRLLIVGIILIVFSSFFVIQTFFLSGFIFFGVEPKSAVTSPKAIDLIGYHTKSDSKYTHYIPMTVEFTDPDGNITNVLAYYSFSEGSVGIEFLSRDFEVGSGIYGYFYTKSIKIEESKPDPVPDYSYLFVETQITLRDGSTYGDKYKVAYQLSYNIELTESEKAGVEGLVDNPISVISHIPPSGLGAVVSWEFMLFIPIVLSALAFKRRERE